VVVEVPVEACALEIARVLTQIAAVRIKSESRMSVLVKV
jgi:hypothetical protein